MSGILVGCSITLRDDSEDACYVVQSRHYEELKDRLDRGETGWIELDSVHGDGKVFCRVEDILHLFHATESFAREREAHTAASHFE